MNEPVVSERQIGRDEFDALLVRNNRRLRGLVAVLCARLENVDEIVQNASLVAWQKIESFSYRSAEPDEEFLRWVGAIARFELLAYRRRNGPGVVLFDEELMKDLVDMRLDEADYFEARHRALVGCLDRLAARDRAMICDRYINGLSVQDLSQSSGRGVEAIYKALGRIRAMLFLCIDRKLKQEDS